MASHQHRILIYTTCYNVLDGVTLTIRKIEQEILAAGHHVCIVSTKSGNMKCTNMDGEHPNRTVIFLDNSIPIPFLHDPNHPDNSYHMGFSLSKAVRERIEEFEPSLIHITVPDCTCLHLIEYARKMEIPLMGTYHSNIPEYMTHYPGITWLKHVLAAFFRHQYNFLQALYVPTPFIHRHLTTTSHMDKATNLRVWGRGIDLDQFSPKHRSKMFRQSMGFNDNDVVICWVGRLVPEKRPDIFCSVIRRLHENNIPFRALVVGAGPLEQAIKDLPNTTFAGWMNGEELSVAYASSDLFLFPSAVETFGNVTLEAAASGLPLVVEAGCSGHLVNHGLNGFACHSDDVDAYYDGTLCLVLDDIRRKQMSAEGRKFSLQFEKRKICQKMLKNYSAVTEEFFTVYGGRHSNRDAAYQHEHSFEGGTNPRPSLLVFVEMIFILFFRVMYQMVTTWFSIRDRMFPSMNQSDQTVQGRNDLISPLISANKLPIDEVTGSDDNNDLGTSLDVIDEVEECSDSDVENQDSDMEDVPMSKVIVKADDDTESTSSLSVESAPRKKNKQESWCSIYPADFRLTHAIAIGFVKLMQFQFRMENKVRTGVSNCCVPSQWNNSKRKRKNSSIGMDIFDDDDKERSGSDSVADEMELMMNSGREDRLNMRRSHLSLVDL